MDEEFKSLDDLYKRVKPALQTRIHEFQEIGYLITEKEIWEYLKHKWVKGNNLTLYDIVKDIMNVSSEELNNYVRGSE